MKFTPLWRETSEGRRFLLLYLLGIVSVSCLILTGLPQQAYGAEAVKGTVKCKSGIVRESASQKANCVFCVKQGEDVLVLSEEESKDKNKWYKIRVLDQTGYIRSDLINKTKEKVTVDDSAEKKEPEKAQETQQSTTVTSQLGKVKGSGVNIRKEPVDGKVVTRLTAGDNITVTKSVRGSDDQTWYAISFVQNKEAMTGYIRSDFVEGVTITGNTAASQTASEAIQNRAFIRGTSVRVRDKEVAGAVVVQLNTGHDLTILDEVKGSDNYVWYHVSFLYQGAQKEGYVRSDLVTRNSASQGATVALADPAFESVIAEMPDSYKNNLRILHSKYPNWKITPVNTGLSWNDVVTAECAIGKNLTPISSIPSWKSTDPRAYNSEKEIWYGFDGGSWAAASAEIIRYYLDPRNFLDDSGIFQFETLEYADYQNESGTANVLAGSFMSGSYNDADGVTRSFATTFTDAAKENGISPYHLASRCLQEQGLTGKSESVSGTVGGYENLFNFFNIGAYAANGLSAPINGLIYASGSDEAYLRPWNTRYRSIMGAAKYISEKYVKKGQNTLYFQKFNVINASNGIYSHQYMSNISAASSEGSRLRRAYTDLNTELEFRIPYYKDMPEAACPKPTSASNPNSELASLAVEGYNITPAFSAANDYYTLIVDKSVSSVNIQATCANQYASVGGTGTVNVKNGTNVYYIVCKAQNGSTKTYTLTIVQK